MLLNAMCLRLRNMQQIFHTNNRDAVRNSQTLGWKFMTISGLFFSQLFKHILVYYKHGVGPQVFPTLVTALPLQCIYLRIEIQIFSFHWMMKNIRLF